MNSPRPRDVVRAEIIRLHAHRRRYRHADPLLQRRLHAALDRRIDRLLDELAGPPAIPAQRRAPDDDPHLAGSRGQGVRAGT